MTFDEALKLVAKEVHIEPHIVIQFSYSARYILPHKEGLAIIDSLRKAEFLTDSYSNPQIRPIPKDQLSISLLPHEEYARYKVAQLLGVSYEEACTLEKESELSKAA